MLISSNPEPSNLEFSNLLENTLNTLNSESKNKESEYLQLLGNKLEYKVHDVMSNLAIGTPFEDSIELISGQKFPDIIANKFYGVEVKSTKQNHWKTTGNSVLESTRVEGIERIYMMFGKIFSPIEFKCRPYEECLSEVVVTHSPRYLIDMDLEKGKTIFDKIDIPYDVLRNETNPIKPITDYYRQFLKSGEAVWWLDQDETKSKGLIIQLWNNLSFSLRKEYMSRIMIFFPEVFSNHSDKFNRAAVWLVNSESIVCPNMRDIFTAGGRGNVKLNNYLYQDIPRVIIKLIDSLDNILCLIKNTDSEILNSYWQKSGENKINSWIEMVSDNSKFMDLPFNIKEYLDSYFQN